MNKKLLIMTLTILILSFSKVKADTWKLHFIGEMRPTSEWQYNVPYAYDYMEKEHTNFTNYIKQSIEFENLIPTNKQINKIEINGFIRNVYLETQINLQCTEETSGYCTEWYDTEGNSALTFQIWIGNTWNQCKIEYNNLKSNAVDTEQYLWWTASCPYDIRYGDRNHILYSIQVRDFASGSSNKYYLGIGRNIYISVSDSQEIIDNTQEIENQLNQTQEYTEDMNTNMTGVNETIEYSQKEKNLKDQLDLNTSMLDGLNIDANTSGFIWDIVGGLRSMNPAIITLMSTMLGLGVIRMILNR